MRKARLIPFFSLRETAAAGRSVTTVTMEEGEGGGRLLSR